MEGTQALIWLRLLGMLCRDAVLVKCVDYVQYCLELERIDRCYSQCRHARSMHFTWLHTECNFDMDVVAEFS